MNALPPRPGRKAPPEPESFDVEVPEPSLPPLALRPFEIEGVELDEPVRSQLSEAIAKAVAGTLGHVRISSVPPSAPRSSMRVAADAAIVGGKVGLKGLKWGAIVSGALSFSASLIVWTMRPEYAAPLAQALKLLAQVIAMAAGGGPPVTD